MRKLLLILCILSLSFVYAKSTNDELSATILGYKSLLESNKKKESSVLITQGKTSILIDIGEDSQINLDKMGFDIFNISALFFTQQNSKHITNQVPSMINTISKNNNFSIIAPNNLQIKNSNNKKVQGGETFYIHDIKITTLKSNHPTFPISYRFEYDNKSIIVTGDNSYIKNKPFFSKNVDYIIIKSDKNVRIAFN